jgi:hypothetical protein
MQKWGRTRKNERKKRKNNGLLDIKSRPGEEAALTF